MASIANLVRGTRREFFEPFARAGTNAGTPAEPLGGCPGSQGPAQDILVCKHDGGQITHELIRRDVVASLFFEVGIDPTVVIRWKGVALDRGRHAEPRVLRLGRSALSAERSTTNVAPDRDGGGLRFARNPGVRQVNARWPFRTAGPRSRSRRATACPPRANGRVGKSFHPVEVMTRAERTLSIHEHPVRCGPEVPRC